MKQKFLNLVLATMLLCFVSPAFANVAKIGDTEYATLSEAITAAAAGQTITLIDDAAESVTIGKNLTIDGAGKKLTGGITTSSSSYITVTVKNLVLDGNNMAVNYAVTVNKAQNFVIENCQANNFGYGFLYVNKSNNIVTVKNITIENCNYGVRAAAFNKLNLENFDTKNVKYPVQVKANATKTVNMTDCDILEVKDGGSALSTWEANSAVTFNFNGNNVFDEELPASAGINYSDSKETNVTIAKNVAKIGDKGYKSLAEALAAIGAGDVVIELLEDATLNYGAREAYGTAETTSVTINGNGKTLTLNQTNSDWSSFGLAAGKVVFNNMTIEKTGYGDTGGAWNTHAIIFSSPVEMADVTVNQSMAVQAGATLNNVTINEANGFYGLWINGNGQAVTVNGGAINATNGGRGIKIADQYIAEPAQVTLNVDGTVFSTAKKAAVLVSSKAGAKIAAANVNIENVVEDPVNFVWIDEDWAAHYDKVEVTGAQVKHEGDFVAKLSDGTFHKALADAITAAPAGATITLIADVNENVTISKNLTIDGAGKQYTGTMTGNAGLTVTVQNVNFVNGYFTKPKSTSGVYSFKNCTFDGNNGALNYSLDIKGANTLNVENCSAKNYKYGLLYVPNGLANASVKNVTVDGCPNYAIYFASGVTYGANIEGLTVKNANNGLIINNTTARSLTIKDCKMENVATAINHSKGTNAINVTVNGAIDFGGAAMSQYVNLAGGTAVVAKVGEVNYLSLADAVAAAQAGETVELVNDATGAGVVINKDITIDFAGKTYTFNKTVGSAGTTTLGLQILKGNNVTLKNGTLTSTAVVAGKEVKMLIQNYANLTLENMKIVDATDHILYALSNNCGETLLTGNTNITTDAVAFDSYKDKAYTAPTVTVETTGKIEGKIEKSDDATIAIKSGIFTVAIEPAWCAEGYVPVANADGTYGVKEDPTIGKVAKVGEEYYKTFAAAVAAAPAGATITLIADATEDATVILTKNLTIDGADHTFTGAIEFKMSNGYFTVKNVKFNGAGTRVYALKSQASTTSLKVENCEATGYTYGFLYANSAIANVTVTDVTVTDVNYGVHSARGTNVTLNNYTVENVKYGVMVQNYSGRNVVLNNCSFTNSENPLYIWKRDGCENKITFTFKGANEMGKADYCTSNYAVVKAAAQVGTKVCGTLADAVEAAEAGETVKLLSNVELSTFLTINKSITLDLGEYNITRADGTGLYVDGDVEVVINGTGKVSGAQALYVANGLVKVNGGNFVGNKEAVYVQLNGKVEIYGGTFEATDDDKTFVLNKKDSDRATTSITVYGGTFVGFDPANNAAEGKNTNFVAEGYASVDNGDGTYTVAEAAVPVAEVGGKTYSSLNAAFAAAQNGETVTLVADVELTSADVVTTSDGYNGFAVVEGKSITFDMNGRKISVNHQSTTNRIYSVIFIADGASLTVTGNGTIDVDADDNAPKVAYVFWKRGTTGTLVIENGNFHADNTEDSMVYTNGSGIVTVNGGTFTLDAVGTRVNKFPCIFNTAGNNERFITVGGGTYNDDISNQHWTKEVQLVEGKITADNGDGTWTVVPGYDEFTIVHDDWKGKAFVNENDMPVNTLNYVRKFSNTNWRAFYVPFAINYDDIKDNFEVRRLEMAHDIEKADGSVEIKFDFMTIRDGQTLKANYPYLIKPKQAGEYTITVKNTTLKKTVSRSIDCSTVDHKFIFTGIYETVSGQEMVDNKYYAMNANELQYATNPDKHALNPFNWYMKIETREDLSDAKFVFGGDFEDEETTGITNIDNDQKNDGNIYDLQGRRVLHPQKGSLYIVNGKKVVY